MKKGFLTRDVVITAILFTGVIALFMIMVGAVSINYNRPDMTSPSFDRNYNRLNELAGEVEISRSEASSGGGFQLLENFDVVFNAVFTVIRLVFSTIDLYGDMASNMIADFTFLDATTVKTLGVRLIALLVVVVVFGWMSSVSRGKI